MRGGGAATWSVAIGIAIGIDRRNRLSDFNSTLKKPISDSDCDTDSDSEASGGMFLHMERPKEAL
jgi:hypothetical protein